MEKLKAIASRDKKIYSLFFLIFSLYLFYSLALRGTISFPFIYITTLYTALSITLSISSFTYLFFLILKKEKRPLSKFLFVAKKPFMNPVDSVNFLVILTFITMVFSIYTDVKSSIPEINTYYLDPMLSKLDNALHFGIPPWKITHYIFSSYLSSAIINLFYNLWFFICWIFIIVFSCLNNNRKLRESTLISFLLCWVINGSISATLFSSVGPCFYDLLYEGSHKFDELMLILNQQNMHLEQEGYFLGIWSLNTQDMLWESYTVQSNELGSGISAMPSMHVSMATLMALATYSLKKWLGVIFWIYMVIIQIGSVHLGWHYALDGYVGALMTIGIWLSVNKLSRPRQDT